MNLPLLIRHAKLALIGLLSGLLLRNATAAGYIIYDRSFAKWVKRGVFALAVIIFCYHCAGCQTPSPQVIPASDTLPADWWYRAMVPYDTFKVRDSMPDIRDTMDIIAILPDWETGQVETVKGRMVRQTEGPGWDFYIVRQKCQEVPRTQGKKTLYEYQCHPVWQWTEPQKIAHFYIKPLPKKAVTPTPDR